MRLAIPLTLLVFILVLTLGATAADGPTTHAYVEDHTDRQQLDHYRAPGDGLRPAVIFVHGGGWWRGDRRVARIFADNFNDAGVDVISVGYRLVPDVAWPDNVRDVAAAVDWVFDHAEELGIDPQRVTIMGHSAGAHLSACVGADKRWLAEHERCPSDLAGVILLDGAAYDIPDLLSVPRPQLERNYHRAFTNDPAVWRDASPTLNTGDVAARSWLAILAADRRAPGLQSAKLFEALPDGTKTQTIKTESDDHSAVLRTLANSDDPELAVIIELVRNDALEQGDIDR
ncbi:MAG: alpha/beta hydrolase [Planctomycetota bacterium]